MIEISKTIALGGSEIAYRTRSGRQPGVMFFGGFMSDMTGTKATMLDDYCRRRDRAFIRFDYSGHGESSGRFDDGTIGQWSADAVAVMDHVAEGPLLIVGSSMGGWIGLLAANERPDLVAGFIGIAAAPDFTEDMMWDEFDDVVREKLRADGFSYEAPDNGDDPHPIATRFIEAARDHLVLRSPLELDCPVRLIQGMQDADVPWRTALRLAEHITGDDVEVTLVKNGDHRLSQPADLARLERTLDLLLGEQSA